MSRCGPVVPGGVFFEKPTRKLPYLGRPGSIITKYGQHMGDMGGMY